jgi:gas vesicle protein
MNESWERSRESGFGFGLLMGACVGAGLVWWFAPRMAAEIRQRATDSAKGLGQRASRHYRQAGVHLGEAVDELTRKGQSIRDEVADAVAHGGRAVERAATAVKS